MGTLREGRELGEDGEDQGEDAPDYMCVEAYETTSGRRERRWVRCGGTEDIASFAKVLYLV